MSISAVNGATGYLGFHSSLQKIGGQPSQYIQQPKPQSTSEEGRESAAEKGREANLKHNVTKSNSINLYA